MVPGITYCSNLSALKSHSKNPGYLVLRESLSESGLVTVTPSHNQQEHESSLVVYYSYHLQSNCYHSY